jgi:soluble lytic murein transglycosylase-like protein
MNRLPIAIIGITLTMALGAFGAAMAEDAGSLYYEVEGGQVVFTNTPTAEDARPLPGWEAPRTFRPTAVLLTVTRWDPYIDHAAKSAGISPELLKAVARVESAFDPLARSPKGALGLMQLMPATAVQYGVSDPFDAWQNLHAGARHLRKMLDTFGDLNLALAAYNAGAGAVRRHGGIPAFAETQAYVRKVRGLLGAPSSARGPAPKAARVQHVSAVRMEQGSDGSFVIRN